MTISIHSRALIRKTEPRSLGLRPKSFNFKCKLASSFAFQTYSLTEFIFLLPSAEFERRLKTIKARSANQSNCELLKSALQFRKTEAPSLLTGEGVNVASATGSSSWGIYQIPPHEEYNKHRLRPAHAGSRLQGASRRYPANQPSMGAPLGKPVACRDDIERHPSPGLIAAAHRSKRPSFGHGCWAGRRLVQSSAKGQRVAQSHLRLSQHQQARSAVCGPCLKFFVPCK